MKRLAAALGLVATLVAGALVAGAVAGNVSLASIAQLTTGTTVTETVTTTTTTTTTTPRPRPQTRRITICHHAPPANAVRRRGTVRHVTIRIPVRALRGHVRHGDTVGHCTSQRSGVLHNSRVHVKRWHPKRTLRAELRSKRRR